MKTAVEIIKVVQSGSVAGTIFMLLCPEEVFGKSISFPYPWLVFGFLTSAVVSSICLGVMGVPKRAQMGWLLTLGAILVGAMLAHA